MKKVILVLLMIAGLYSYYIDADFEGGNIDSVEQVGDTIKFASRLDPPGPRRRTTWFYFRVGGVQGKSLHFVLKNARGSYTENSRWDHLWIPYSYDQDTWHLAEYPGTGAASSGQPFYFDVPGTNSVFLEDTVYIAYNIPYTYSDAQHDIYRWKHTRYCQSVEVIGQSVQGRDIHFLTFEDKSSPVPTKDKKTMWIQARLHPLEPIANYQLQGIVDWYCDSTDQEAETFRKDWILYVIPDINPDGMYNGYTRTNANGVDLNRCWQASPDPVNEEPEVYAAHSKIQEIYDNGGHVDIYFDMHCRASSDAGGYRGNTSLTQYVIMHGLWTLCNFNVVTIGNGGSTYCTGRIGNGYGIPAYTVEGPNRAFDNNSPATVAGGRAYGIAWAKSAIGELAEKARVFGFKEERIRQEGNDPNDLYIISPGKFRCRIAGTWGGAITRWYNLKSSSTDGLDLADHTNGLDVIRFWKGGVQYACSNSNIDTLPIIEYFGPELIRFTYKGEFGHNSDLDYEVTKTVRADGRIFEIYKIINTGNSVTFDSGGFFIMSQNPNYTKMYDNFDTSPEPNGAEPDRWIALVGNSGGSPPNRSVIVAYYVGSEGDFYYNRLVQNSSGNAYIGYLDGDGFTIDKDDTLVLKLVYQIHPDNDALASETGIDVYVHDILHPDNPTVLKGSFVEYDTSFGALVFNAEDNEVRFRHRNADIYEKKSPLYIIKNYYAKTAPILKIDDNFLINENGDPHNFVAFDSDSYASYVDTVNHIAYVHYFGSITGTEIDIKDNFSSYKKRSGAWSLSFNSGAEEWYGDTLRFCTYDTTLHSHFLQLNNSPVDGGMYWGVWIDNTVDNWYLYRVFYGIVPKASDCDSLILYAWKASSNTYDGLYVQLLIDDVGLGWNFDTQEWASSGFTKLLHLSDTPTRYAFKVDFWTWGHFTIKVIPAYDVSTGSDTFYIDSFYIKRAKDYERDPKYVKTNGYVLLGFDWNSDYEDKLVDWREDLQKLGMRYTRIFPYLYDYAIVDTIDAENDYLITDYTMYDSVMKIAIDSLGLEIVEMIDFRNGQDLGPRGMRFYTLSGSTKIPYAKDAAMVVSDLMKHNQEEKYDIWLYMVLNEKHGAMDSQEDADSFANLFYTIRDTIQAYDPDAIVMFAGDCWWRSDTMWDSIGCTYECFNGPRIANHLYGHPTSGRYGWSERDWQMYTYGMLFNTNGALGNPHMDVPLHIIDEFHTSIDYNFNCSGKKFWQWLGIPVVLTYHTPLILMDHILFGDWSSCQQTINWNTGEKGALYYGFELLAKYSGKSIWKGEVDAPYVTCRLGNRSYVYSNPSQTDTFYVKVPWGLAKFNWLDADAYYKGEYPIKHRYRFMRGKLTLPPGCFYVLDYITISNGKGVGKW